MRKIRSGLSVWPSVDLWFTWRNETVACEVKQGLTEEEVTASLKALDDKAQTPRSPAPSK